MARIGADYYPKVEEIKEIVANNIKGVKVDESIGLNFSGDPFKLYRDYKISILGINNFVVKDNMEERRVKRLHQIDIGALDRKMLFYNPVEIYKIACEICYITNVIEDPYKRATSFKVLNNEMEMLVKRGVNLEEIKKDLLLDNFLAFNDVDPVHINTDYNEVIVENALKTYNTLCRYEKVSPYEKVLSHFVSTKNEKDRDLAQRKAVAFKKELKDYDLNMLRMFAYDKAVSEILKCIMQLRYSVRENHSLDMISEVVTVKPVLEILNEQPISRRQFSEEIVQNVYDIATLKGEVSLGELFDIYKGLVREVKKQVKDVNAGVMVEDFADILSFYKELVDIEKQNEHTPSDDYGSGYDM